MARYGGPTPVGISEPKKKFEELSPQEQIEVLRNYVKIVIPQLQKHIRDLQQKAALMESHEHGKDGGPTVSIIEAGGDPDPYGDFQGVVDPERFGL